MRTLKESILDRLDESILGSNSAGIVGAVKDMLQTNPGLGKKRTDHLNKLNDLWGKLGLDEDGYFWTFDTGAYMLKQDPNTHKPKAYFNTDNLFYIASNADKENQINVELRDKIIKVLGLKFAAKFSYWICYRL